jgi:O-antigen/teichoic acid export membrane protein
MRTTKLASRSKLNKIPFKGEFAKNAFLLTVGTTIAQFFPMLFYPILGRIYTPLEFGLLATLSSITSIITVLATGNYENSILIARSKKDAANIIALVLLLSSSFLIFSFIILKLISNHISVWFNEPSIKKWLFICPISAFAIIIFNCYNEWCVRNKYFTRLAWNKITNSSATTLSKLFFGFVKISSKGLVIGDLIGRMISAGGCIFRALRKDKNVFYQISFRQMPLLARRYAEFPKFSLPAQLLNTIGDSIPVFLIGAYFKSIEVGYYAMTMNVLSVPISIISRAIRDVFRQRANEEYVETGSCLKIYKRLLKVLLLCGVLGSIIMIFALPSIFSVFLGKQWRIAGEYSQILLPMITINFVYISLSGVLIITENMRIVFYWQIYYATITIISLLLGCIIFQDIKTTLICFSIGRSTAYLLEIFLSYKYSKGNIANE